MAEPNVVGRERQTTTIEAMYDMPRDGRKYELIEGEVNVSPAGMKHEEIGIELAFLMKLYLRANPIGRVYGSSTGYALDSGDVLSPDVSFVALDRLPQGQSPQGFGQMAPDLAVEIASPNDSLEFMDEKARQYLASGSKLVWVIVPRSKRALIYRANRKLQVVEGDEPLDGEDVLPGFACPLSEVLGS